MISFGALLLGSCTSTEVDPKFDANATERLSGRKKELNDLYYPLQKDGKRFIIPIVHN